MSPRIDKASRLVAAPPGRLYDAFAQPGALERWLPPDGMRGAMLHFDFRPGGSYRMRLTYAERGTGKSGDDHDDAEVRLTALVPGERIEQEVVFDSADPAFAGTMRMTWTFAPRDGGTLVTVAAAEVPAGIDGADHEAAMASSLLNLARFVESGPA